MNDPTRWSVDQDPPRDESLARLLRTAEGSAAGDDMKWERLRAAIMRRVAQRDGATADREWWDVLVQWRRFAAAASIAAMLAAAALLWRSSGVGEVTLTEDDPPESVALARVVAAYPNDAVLASLLQATRTDELASWSGP